MDIYTHAYLHTHTHTHTHTNIHTYLALVTGGLKIDLLLSGGLPSLGNTGFAK